MDNLSAKKRGLRGKKFQFFINPILLCLFLSLIAGLIFTWPLTFNFFSAIPYTLRPISGFEQVPLMPGDHLQTYYWFWLLKDNLWGHSALFTNPYEFNGPAGPMSTVYANFPFSLIYILLLPLGPIGAYNGLIILSFLLSGLAMFLLARTWTEDFWASLLAGLVFATVPYRVSHIAGGQLFGYVIFLLPLCLYFVERTLEKGRWTYAGVAGLCIVLMSLMDPHTSFLTALTIGVYLPSRILIVRSFPLEPSQEKQSLWPGLAGVIIGGLSFSCFLWMKLGAKAGLSFWHVGMIQPMILGTLSFLLLWFYLSAMFARLTTLSFIEARLRIGKAFLFFLPLMLYALKYKLEIPRLGLILPLLCGGLFLTYLFVLWIKERDRLGLFDHSRIIPVILGVGMGLSIASAYLLHIRSTVFLPSLAGKGRTIGEVLLFSPRAGNLFFWQDINKERFVLLGWGLIIMACLGLVPLFRNRPKNQGHLALAALMAFGAVVLTLGPTLTYFPVYEVLYRYFPFFNYPRVPGRFVMVGFIFLGLLAAMVLAAFREWLAEKGWKRLRQGLPLLVIALILAEYHTFQPIGLSLMNGESRIYKEIGDRLPKGKVLLELPIWPGDSHQSSAYEYTVTRTRRPMVNGYAPVVVRDYIKKVFWPLYPLDQGELLAAQDEELKKLKVGLITFHDNPQIFTEKVSPFPARLALKRLMASPSLKLGAHDQDIFLFEFNSLSPAASTELQNPPFLPLLKGGLKNPPLVKGEAKSLPLKKGDLGGFKKGSDITSPVTAVFYVNNLPHETGRYQWDPSASGYYLLMNEAGLNQNKLIPRPGTQGNVILALPGRDQPGYLTLGANRYFPAGKYRARFRVKSGTAGPQEEVGRVEVLKGRTEVLAQKNLLGGDFRDVRAWTDIPLDFELPQAGDVGFRVYFSGQVPLSLNLILIGFADQSIGPGSVEAEDLLRQTGTVVPDSLASGKEAVWGKAGFHPPIYLCYGPYQTFEPGRYRAEFFLRLKGPVRISEKTEVALLEIASDMGKRVLAVRKIKAQDLKANAYRPIEVDFQIPFRCELGYRVKFSGKADLLVDRISVE